MIKSKHYCDWCGKEIKCADIIISYPTPCETDERTGLTTMYAVARPRPEELCDECASLVWKARPRHKQIDDYDDTPCINCRDCE